MSFDQFKHETKIQILRPAILPDNRKLFFYPIIVGTAVSIAGVFLSNIIIIVLPLIILTVFPGLPIFFHLIFHLFVKIELLSDKLVIIDYVGNRFVKSKTRQEIHFSDICYIYYVGKEVNLLLNLKTKLKKFKIPAKETNYTKDNLFNRYTVPKDIFERFEKSSQKTLTDYTATGVLMKLDEIYNKYDVPNETRKNIQKELKDNCNFNPDYLKTALEKYTISSEDMASLYDEFSNINTDFLVPLLLTNINLARYQKAEKQRHGASVTARADNGLVLSNGDGTKKVYFMHFHNLSEKDLRRFVGTINARNPDVKYLVPKKEFKLFFTK